jgi:ABC-2 type transport system ATP-binding protein
MQADIVIQTKDLSKIYKDFWGRPRVKAVDRLNLQIQRGEIFGILGPNGSGKTTTMKLLLGLLFPTEGQAWVLGAPPTDIATKAKIGFLPEESYLYRFLNADETLDFYARLFNIPRAQRKRRIDELIELFGIGHARRRPLKEYSRGMVRRVSFAQALINDPEIIFLDEPTSGLDPISSKQMKDLMLDLKRKGKTIFLSSHLLGDVQNICDRVAILHEGKLVEHGSVKALLSIGDLTSMVFKGGDNNLEQKVRELIEQSGAEVISSGTASESLENLFLRVIEGKKADGAAASDNRPDT